MIGQWRHLKRLRFIFIYSLIQEILVYLQGYASIRHVQKLYHFHLAGSTKHDYLGLPQVELIFVFTQIKPVASLFLLSMLLTWLLQIPVLTKFIWYISRWICPRFLYLYNIQSDCITRFYVSHQWFCVVFTIYKTIQIFNLNCW